LLEKFDPQWAESCRLMSTSPWTSTALPEKSVELISLALNAACTNLYPDATRRHIRGALQAGATTAEILLVIKMASLLSIHSCSLGAPILLEEAAAAGIAHSPPKTGMAETPVSDRMRASGMWNDAWDPFFALDPSWTEQFMATGVGVYAGGIIEPKLAELLSIAFDASFTHMYAPGTRRHIKAALKLGATVAEITEVLKLSVAHGVQASNMALPILHDELQRAEAKR
jgi:alkylhydroperoxidase/carboxymuconolactone decarboxylase family protein YurZ